MLVKPRKNEQQEGLRMRIREIANDSLALVVNGSMSCLSMKAGINHKRVHRLMSLQVRMRRRRKKHMSLLPGKTPPARGSKVRWNMILSTNSWLMD